MPSLIEKFVDLVNSNPREPLSPDIYGAPIPVRADKSDEHGNYDWQIQPISAAPWFDELQGQLSKHFPNLYCELCSNYAFPAFEVREIYLYGNSGDSSYSEELSVRMFADPHMSPILLQNGLLQFGNPFVANYDPVCFDTTRAMKKTNDCPIVVLDHEELLQHSKIKVHTELSPSFEEYLKELVREGKV